MNKNTEAVMERLDLNPGYIEVRAAKAAFTGRLLECEPYTRLPECSAGYMSPECAVACVLAEVWRQGRKYQRDQDKTVLMGLAGMGKEAMV